MKGVKEIYVDHEKVETIPQMQAGTEHFVEIVMG